QQQEVPLSNRQLLAVEFPGIVRNEDRAIRMLGGLDKLAESFAAQLQQPQRLQQQQQHQLRLQLQFNPEDALPRVAVADPVTSRAAFVLRVVRQRHKVTGDERFQIECLGQSGCTYEFNGLADLQYLTFIRSGPNLEQYRDLYDDLVPSRPFDQVEDWFCRDDVPLHLVTMPLSRPDAQSDYRLWEPMRFDPEDSGPQAAAAAAASVADPDVAGPRMFTRKSRCGLTVSTTLADLRKSGAPTGPTPEIEAQVTRLRDLRSQRVLERLDQLLAETPIISIAYVSHCLRDIANRSQAKLLIKAKAYHMYRGPWHHLWLRFGYNPIVESGAAIYQCLDVRVRQIRRHGRSVSAGSEFSLEPDRLPRVGQLCLQLCHIHVPSIAERVAAAPIQPVCHDTFGWYSESDMAEFRQLTREHVRRLLPRAVLAASADSAASASSTGTTAADSAAAATANETAIDDAELDEEGDDDDLDEEDDEDVDDEELASNLIPTQQQQQQPLLPPLPDDAEDLLVTLTSGQ
ncbi:hypothetical protein BOX15_Mlig014743g3, partial [Macrostomum lignano]